MVNMFKMLGLALSFRAIYFYIYICVHTYLCLPIIRLKSDIQHIDIIIRMILSCMHSIYCHYNHNVSVLQVVILIL